MRKINNNNPGYTVVLKNVELPNAIKISFTADAISACSQYLKNAAYINLDDWEWYKDIRAGEELYIITSYKIRDGLL